MAIATQRSMRSSLDALVDDVLIQILSILPVWDVLRVRQTSKRMEALSHICAVWQALFERDVLTCGRPVPGFSFTPTPRLMKLFALDPADDLYHTEFSIDMYDDARALIESSDLEARTVHALRLEKLWTAQSETACGTSETHLRTFCTPAPIRNVFLLPGGRFVVSTHTDRLRCWDLGVAHSPKECSVLCVGEWILSRIFASAETTMCMDSRAPTFGKRESSSVCFALCADIIPSWNTGAQVQNELEKRTCEILSVRLDPLRSGPFDLPGTGTGVGVGVGVGIGSPFASPVPFFRREAVICLPDVLPTPVYLEPSPPEEWGPHRFAKGKLGRLVFVYGSMLFFESFVPPQPGADKPMYAGIEVFDANEPYKTVLFEYPDPSFGPFVGVHVHASAAQILVVWQICIGLYPLPFALASSPSSSASSASSSRPSTPSSFSTPSSSSPYSSPYLSSSCTSPGSSRSALDLQDMKMTNENVEVDESVNRDAYAETRVVMMPSVIIALNEPVSAPVAFSTCSMEGAGCKSGAGTDDRNHYQQQENGDDLPSPLTIVARSFSDPTRTVQSVLTASLPPPSDSYPFAVSSSPSSESDRYSLRLTRIPATTPSSSSGREGQGAVAALVLGTSGRGVCADMSGALYRCTRADIILPCGGPWPGFSMGMGAWRAPVAPSVDFWPWSCAAVLPEAVSESQNLVLRFDDGMGRVVAARVPSGTDDLRQDASRLEVMVLDFA